jgi:hypothetical protein
MTRLALSCGTQEAVRLINLASAGSCFIPVALNPSDHERDDDMTATTGLIDAGLLHAEAPNGISYAYRRFGNAAAGVPVVFLQHFRGNIDNWDPALIDAVAADREVILFDNVGVGGGPTEPPRAPSRRWPLTPWRSSMPSA